MPFVVTCLACSDLRSTPTINPFSQPAILDFQFRNQLDELSPLVPQLDKLLNFFSAAERRHLVDVVSGPFRELVDSR